MKTPISYYGGKQSLSSLIVGLISGHRIYCEPFFGGGAVFFAKNPSEVEVINDTNRELINFYEVVRYSFPDLEHEISLSLHSHDMHRQAEVVYTNPDMFGRMKRAWAVWMLANCSYGCKLDGCRLRQDRRNEQEDGQQAQVVHGGLCKKAEPRPD